MNCLRSMGITALATAALVGTTGAALAQIQDFGNVFGSAGGETTWSRMVQLAIVLTGLSLAPALVMMVTCLPRFLIVFSFLRTGLGLPSTPSNTVLIGLAMFMTLFVMAPTFDKAWQEGAGPLGQNRISANEAVPKMIAPFRAFMIANTREKDLQIFKSLAGGRMEATDEHEATDLRILVPAFMTSELRRAFEIGFLVVLPFLVIDLVVATVAMSMGMMMVSPQAFSMPLKVLFFVLIDGWTLLVGSLVRSFR